MSDVLIPIGTTQKYLRGFDTGDGIDEYVRISNPEPLRVNSVDTEHTVFNETVVTSRSNQWEVQFWQGTPEEMMRTISKTGSAGSEQTEGLGHIYSGTDATCEIVLETWETITYSSARELGIDFTAMFTNPPTGVNDEAFVRFGNEIDSYDLGFFGRDTLGLVGGAAVRGGIRWRRNSAMQSFVELDPNNIQVLRDGVYEPLDILKNNVYRVPFGWLSTAPTYIKVMHPDGIYASTGTPWQRIYELKHPNNQAFAQWTSPNRPAQIVIRKVGSDATNVGLKMGCIAGYIAAQVSVAQNPQGAFVINKADGVVFTNSTPLAASASFTSDWHRTTGWQTFQILIATDQVSAGDGIAIEYTDAVHANTPVVRATEYYTFTAEDVALGFISIVATPKLDGCRIRYTNGGVDQTSFFISARLRAQPAGVPLSSLAGPISRTMSTVNGRNALFAENDLGVSDLIKRGSAGGMRTSVNQFEAPAPLKSDNDTSMGTGTVDTAGGKIIDHTAIPAGATGCQIQASNANGNPLLYLAKSQAGSVGGVSAGVDLAAGQSQYFSLGELTISDIWGAAQSSTVRWRVIWLIGGGA